MHIRTLLRLRHPFDEEELYLGLLYLVVEMKSGELAMVQRYDETEEIDPDPTWGHRWTENKTNLGCFHGRDRRRGFVPRTQRSIVILMP